MTFDSQEDNNFHVHLQNGNVHSYKESRRGLYYHDIRKNKGDFVCINTVSYIKTNILKKSTYTH